MRGWGLCGGYKPQHWTEDKTMEAGAGGMRELRGVRCIVWRQIEIHRNLFINRFRKQHNTRRARTPILSRTSNDYLDIVEP